MTQILYTCPFVPAELIKAAGLEPYRTTGLYKNGKDFFGLSEGLCPFVNAFAGAVLSSDKSRIAGAVLTTACDQMTRAFDMLSEQLGEKVFLMNVPATVTPAAKQLYRDELARLQRYLSAVGGRKSSAPELARTMTEYNSMRKILQDAEQKLSARRWAESVDVFHRGGTIQSDLPDDYNNTSAVRIAIVGGPLPAEEFQLFDTIEEAGGLVALNAAETGTLGLCGQFDIKHLSQNPFDELCGTYFNSLPLPWRRPNNLFYDWLGRKITERKITAIIVRRYIWCDLWHGEVHRIKNTFGLPLLDLDINGKGIIPHQASSRIQAFMEMLR